MKNILLMCLLFCLFTLYVYGQPGWIEQNSGTRANLRAVDFINENIGWVAGGIIKKTTNGGELWEETGKHSASGAGFYSISFPSEEKGHVCGYVYVNNYYLKNWASTENGGAEWDYPTSWSYPAARYYSVFFINENIGWRVGSRGYVYKTTTGVNGFSQLFPSLSETLYSVYFVNENNGWVAGKDGFIAKSRNGGINWETQESGFTGDLNSIFFLDTLRGFSAGDEDDVGMIIKTVDGGNTWYQVAHPSTMSLNSIKFINENLGWACGSKVVDLEERGVMLYSDDGGENWIEQYVTDSLSTLYALDFIDELTGWAVGYQGIILKTNNGGITEIADDKTSLPEKYLLSQNFPNPFNPNTKISYQIPKDGFVSLVVYNLLGQEVDKLVNQHQTSGRYSVEFKAEDLTSGVYIYRITSGEFVQSNNMILLR